VVIPAYNEAATIVTVARRSHRQTGWVIVVDDGSTDGTAAQLGELPVTVLRHERNQGKAASLWDGMQHALAHGADAVITLDADGQHRPEDIPSLLAAGRRYPKALIIAARLQGRWRVPRLRRFANRMADFWIAWAAGCPIQDTQSGFRLYPAAILRRLQIPHDPGRAFVFESEILIEAARQGYCPVSVPIEAIYLPQARTSYYRPWRDTAHITRMVAWKLLARGLYLPGLLRSLGLLPCAKAPSAPP
jgi:glycosyltransferase involved in cell wall biosynthesis